MILPHVVMSDISEINKLSSNATRLNWCDFESTLHKKITGVICYHFKQWLLGQDYSKMIHICPKHLLCLQDGSVPLYHVALIDITL